MGGRAEIMELMAFRGDNNWDTSERVPQGGTYNAAPVSAAAGIATLEAIATGKINERADAMADRLKDGLNDSFMRKEIAGHAHGISSIIHINIGLSCNCDQTLCTMPYEDIYRTMTPDKITGMRRAMLVNGVDMMGGRAFLVSSAHNEEIIDRTVAAFDESLNNLRDEGIL